MARAPHKEIWDELEPGSGFPALDGGRGHADPDYDPGHPGSAEGDFWELVDAGFFGDSEVLGGLDAVADEEGDAGASGLVQEPLAAALGRIPDPGKGRKRKAVKSLNRITWEDFAPGTERRAFLLLYDRVRASYLKGSDPEQRHAAINWVFTADDKPDAFELCCAALGARAHVVRLRLHYQFYLDWTVFPAPFPFLTVPLPHDLIGQIMYEAGAEGFALAREAWLWPGIREDLLLERAGVTHRRSLERLEEKGIMAAQMTNWYLCGRSPSLTLREKGGTLSWSSLWA